MSKPRQARNKDTTQYIQNDSYDPDYKVIAHEVLTENEAENALVRQKPIATEAKQDEIIGNYAFQYAENSVDSKIFYIGEAAIGSATSDAVWRIQRYDTNSGIIKQWADGDANFDNVWNNREEISYF